VLTNSRVNKNILYLPLSARFPNKFKTRNSREKHVRQVLPRLTPLVATCSQQGLLDNAELGQVISDTLLVFP
jgi:hypothetical protein